MKTHNNIISWDIYDLKFIDNTRANLKFCFFLNKESRKLALIY